MRKKMGSFILIVSLMLMLMPDTVMAARMEREAVAVQETAGRAEKADQKQREKKEEAVAAGVPVNMEGSGTASDPYRIKDGGQLRYFADMVNGAGSAPNTGLCAVLTQNIDLSGVCSSVIGSWPSIGTEAHPYTGSFDGRSFTVSGLYLHQPNASYAGLFGYNAGTIKNLGVVGADIVAGSYTGSVCGFNRGTITGCYNASSVSGNRSTGGVCGYNDGAGTVSVCYNIGAVNGSKYVGGICGYNQNAVSDCYNVGAVNGSGTSVGGICGYNKRLISGCYNTGEVGGGQKYVGSICGYNHSGSSLLNCYYLITGTEKGNYGAAMTQQQFASGEVCWLLNGGKSENAVWHQTCGAGFPVFGGKTVYQTQTYRGDGSSAFAYTNDRNQRGAQPYAAPAVTEAAGNGGGHVYQEPEWEWDEYKAAKAVFTCRDCGDKLTLEASISKKTTKATCGEEGKTVYTASVERGDQTYEDTQTDKTDKTAHKDIVWTGQTAATCEEPGYTMECYTCLVCGQCFEDAGGKKEIKKKVRIPALGHKYEGVSNWIPESDYSAVTAQFICTRYCGKEPVEVKEKTKVVNTNATCMTAGTTTYRATVKFKGKSYKYEMEVPGKTLPHNYGGAPVWDWPSADGPASAAFGCMNEGCHASEIVPADITSADIKGTDCSSPGKTIYTAKAEFKGKTYTAQKEKELPAQHNIQNKVPQEPATCGKDGNKEYWPCDVCGKFFADQAGTVPVADVVLPATGEHVFRHVRDNIYVCDQCGGTYLVTESGTKQINAVGDEAGIPQEDDVALQDENENDNSVIPSVSDGESQNGTETEEEEAIPQPDQEEKPEETIQGAEIQEDIQNGQEDIQNGQEEGCDGVIDAQENPERYGIIYPEGQEPEPGEGTEGAFEGNAVSFRAERAGTEAAQTAGKQQGSSLWASAAMLAVFAGMVLLFVLKRNDK